MMTFWGTRFIARRATQRAHNFASSQGVHNDNTCFAFFGKFKARFIDRIFIFLSLFIFFSAFCGSNFALLCFAVFFLGVGAGFFSLFCLEIFAFSFFLVRQFLRIRKIACLSQSFSLASCGRSVVSIATFATLRLVPVSNMGSFFAKLGKFRQGFFCFASSTYFHRLFPFNSLVVK